MSSCGDDMRVFVLAPNNILHGSYTLAGLGFQTPCHPSFLRYHLANGMILTMQYPEGPGGFWSCYVGVRLGPPFMETPCRPCMGQELKRGHKKRPQYTMIFILWTPKKAQQPYRPYLEAQGRYHQTITVSPRFPLKHSLKMDIVPCNGYHRLYWEHFGLREFLQGPLV